MNLSKYGLYLAGTLLTAGPAFAGGDSSPCTAGVDIASSYDFLGKRISDETAFQPSVSCQLLPGVSGTLWASSDFEKVSKSPLKNNGSEVDATLTFGSNRFNVEVGYYWYSNLGDTKGDVYVGAHFPLGAGFSGSVEHYAGVSDTTAIGLVFPSLSLREAEITFDMWEVFGRSKEYQMARISAVVPADTHVQFVGDVFYTTDDGEANGTITVRFLT